MNLLKGRSSQVASGLKLFYRAIKDIPILMVALVAVAIAVISYRELNRDVLVIYPFSVPKQYSDSGLTGEVIASRIADAIDDIQTAETSMRIDEIIRPSGSRLRPSIEMPGTGIGLQAVTQILREVFQVHPKHVSGEITLSPPGEKLTQQSEVVVTFRVSISDGRASHAQVSTLALDPKVAAKRTAEAILAIINPYVLAVYEFDRGDEEAALALITQLLEATQVDKLQIVAAYTLWGMVLSKQGKLPEAIAKYQKAIEFDPKYPPPYTNWGNALAKQGKLTEAIAKYQKAIELDPKHALRYMNWGNALYQQGKLSEAITKYRKAIELDPKRALTYVNWGNALYQQGKVSEAIAKYQKCIELDPKHPSSYRNWGSVLHDQGKLAEAIAKFQKCIELDPKDALAYGYWGKALSEQGKLTEAIAKFQKAIELDPKDALPYYNWGLVLFQQGKLTAAIAKYRKAIELDPKYALAHYNWGLALAKLGRHAEAEARFSKARELGFKE